MIGLRETFSNLGFEGAADLIVKGDFVVGRWKGGGTHTGPAFSDSDRFQRLPAEQCSATALRCFVSRTARSQKKSVSTTGSLRCSNSIPYRRPEGPSDQIETGSSFSAAMCLS